MAGIAQRKPEASTAVACNNAVLIALSQGASRFTIVTVRHSRDVRLSPRFCCHTTSVLGFDGSV